MSRFYINGPTDKGDGVYHLIHESGEVVAGSTPDDWALEAIQVGAMALRFLVDLC